MSNMLYPSGLNPQNTNPSAPMISGGPTQPFSLFQPSSFFQAARAKASEKNTPQRISPIR
jgi:hypothetical protein